MTCCHVIKNTCATAEYNNTKHVVKIAARSPLGLGNNCGSTILDTGIILVAVRGYLDHVRRDMLLSSVTCVFDHVAACHVVFLFLEILRQEAMFSAQVKKWQSREDQGYNLYLGSQRQNVIFC